MMGSILVGIGLIVVMVIALKKSKDSDTIGLTKDELTRLEKIMKKRGEK